MKLGRYLVSPLDSNIAWQKGIGTPHPGMKWALNQGIEMDHLHDGMDTGIGTACTESGDAVAGEFA
jgi:hypothetical protein